jgi:hypothetical protein
MNLFKYLSIGLLIICAWLVYRQMDLAVSKNHMSQSLASEQEKVKLALEISNYLLKHPNISKVELLNQFKLKYATEELSSSVLVDMFEIRFQSTGKSEIVLRSGF